MPTVVVGDMTLRMAHEETFGPVVPIVVVDDAEQAIAYSNALDYGLVAYLYTRATCAWPPWGPSGSSSGQ